MKTEDFVRLVVNKLEELAEEVVLQNPTAESIFPCRVVQTALSNVDLTENSTPIEQTFQISVEHWAEKKYECMKMADETDTKLAEYNMVRVQTTPDILDDITNKYRLITTYEVKYNALYNCFKIIR